MAVTSKALFICAHSASRAATQAGHKTAFFFLKELQKSHNVDVVLILTERGLAERQALRAEFESVVFPIGRAWRVFSVVCGLFLGIPPRFATRLSFRALRHVRRLIEHTDYEVIWCEFSSVFWLLPHILHTQGHRSRLVLSAHDICSEVVLRKSWFERTLFLRWTRAYERQVFQLADQIRVQSNKDRRLVSAYDVGAQIDVSPPFVSPFASQVRRTPATIQKHSLLFWGAMNRTENYAAAVAFVTDVLRPLQQKFPDATLYIVGANPHPSLQAVNSADVVVTGFVEDPTPYFERASLGVVPLTQGAGIKVKTLEMLAAGMTVISTPIGAEGIDAAPNLIVTTMNEIASVIETCWNNIVRY